MSVCTMRAATAWEHQRMLSLLSTAGCGHHAALDAIRHANIIARVHTGRSGQTTKEDVDVRGNAGSGRVEGCGEVRFETAVASAEFKRRTWKANLRKIERINALKDLIAGFGKFRPRLS